jgi:transcriptional regulator with XRE-family HTH domain
MSIVSDNIKFLRKNNHMTQEQLAEKIGIKRSLLGAYEEGRADPRLNNLLKISEVFKVSVDTLISEDVSEFESAFGNVFNRKPKTKVLSITVDEEGEEYIDLIPQKASAGYLNGYSDPEYLEDMPKFKLPFLAKNGTYRAFEISGDSMLPLLPGTVIICKYLESASEIKNGKPYILLTSSDGIVFKRVFMDSSHENTCELVSDNKYYQPYKINKEDIMEVWEAVMYISQNFPDPSEDTGSDIGNLKNIVLELQQEMIKLKEKFSA